jgi:hypothetical protein
MQYLHRHNNVTKIIHQQIAIDKKLLTMYTPYYKYTVTEVLENQRYKLYWDREVRTDIRVLANRPDILLYDKKKEVDLIDIAVPLPHNIQNVYAQKLTNMLQLATKIQQMWNMQKINIRPMVISATGIVPQYLKKQLSELEVIQLLPAIQKCVLPDTCHTIRQFLHN